MQLNVGVEWSVPERAGVRTAVPIVIQEPKRAKNNIK